MPTKPYFLKDGSRVSGVTTIISTNLGWSKQGLMYWAWSKGKEGVDYKDISKAAADAGTIAHRAIECDIRNISFERDKEFPEASPEILEKAEIGFSNYLKWKKMSRLVVIKSEFTVISERHKYGGTIDALATIADDLSILDFKTSNAVYSDHLIQLAAYANGYQEIYPDRPLDGGLHILQIGKESATFTHHFYSYLEEEWEAFLHLLALHNLKKTLDKKV
jgi:hypothetical protein